jgi:hypothetical protein
MYIFIIAYALFFNILNGTHLWLRFVNMDVIILNKYILVYVEVS